MTLRSLSSTPRHRPQRPFAWAPTDRRNLWSVFVGRPTAAPATRLALTLGWQVSRLPAAVDTSAVSGEMRQTAGEQDDVACCPTAGPKGRSRLIPVAARLEEEMLDIASIESRNAEVPTSARVWRRTAVAHCNSCRLLPRRLCHSQGGRRYGPDQTAFNGSHDIRHARLLIVNFSNLIDQLQQRGARTARPACACL